jgi:SAM-dependent methyltransferase
MLSAGSRAVRGMTGDPDRASHHWFEAIAEHTGAAYLRYSFTKGTEQEVDFLVEELGLRPGMRVLDVGCGPGRHAHALASRGVEVVGLDISERFVALARAGAPAGASFVRADARTMTYEAEFDAAISLCQGAFGLVPGEDGEVLRRIVRALRPGARAVITAFSAYFQVRWLGEGDEFDADAGVNHELALVRDEDGNDATFDLWTSVWTPRELRLVVVGAGAGVEGLWSVSPGEYGRNPPDVEHPEWLVVLRRPGRG